MTQIMPQEIEVWYLIPALRKEIAKILVKEFNLSQKKVSEILGITESAVSQYLKEKRGNELKFTSKDLKKIKITAKKMVSNQDKTMKYLYNLSKSLIGSKLLCNVHKKYDRNISKGCEICFKN